MKSTERKSQRDYTLAIKLSVVDQVEKGETTYNQAQARYGIPSRSTVLVWLRKQCHVFDQVVAIVFPIHVLASAQYDCRLHA